MCETIDDRIEDSRAGSIAWKCGGDEYIGGDNTVSKSQCRVTETSDDVEREPFAQSRFMDGMGD